MVVLAFYVCLNHPSVRQPRISKGGSKRTLCNLPLRRPSQCNLLFSSPCGTRSARYALCKVQWIPVVVKRLHKSTTRLCPNNHKISRHSTALRTTNMRSFILSPSVPDLRRGKHSLGLPSCRARRHLSLRGFPLTLHRGTNLLHYLSLGNTKKNQPKQAGKSRGVG